MKALRIFALLFFVVVIGAITYLFGYAHGCWSQAVYEAKRWENVRAEMLNPPEFGTRPYRRVIPELGIRVYWFEWRNGPVRQVMLEDLR